MPYYEIQNFAAGMDLRKSALTSPAGTLRSLQNAHVTPGGEIAKREAFELFAACPADSKGLLAKNGLLYAVKSSGAAVPATSTTVGTHVITGGFPGGVTLDSIADWELFNDKFYIVARGSDGLYYHFYDGAYVSTGKGSNVRTYKSKIYGVGNPSAANTIYFSSVGSPTAWSSGTGYGFIVLGAEDGDMDSTVSMEAYYDYLAVFSEEAVQLWTMDPDPLLNTLKQTVRQSGTNAPQSVQGYGSGDVLFLNQSGVRTLRARELTNSAAVSDIGSPMDPYVRELFQTQTTAFMNSAKTVINPVSGRILVVFPDRALVYSGFPGPKISAWSVYSFDTFTVEDCTALTDRVAFRASDGNVYTISGFEAETYDTAAVEVELPFLSFDKPATFKSFKGLDLSCTGQWDIYAALNPHDPTVEDYVGRVTGPTFLSGQFALMGHSTHLSLRFRTPEGYDGEATLSNVIIHYEMSETT